MADLTADGTGGAGLSTRPARHALIAVWVLGLANGAITGWLDEPRNLVPYLALLIGCVVLTRRSDDALPPAAATFVAVTAGTAGAVLLAGQPISGKPWPVDFASYLIALLIARGSGRAAAAGAALLIGAAAMIGRAQSADVHEVAGALFIPVLALVVGVVWRAILRQIVTQERAHRSLAVRAARDIRIAHEAASRYHDELDTIREQAGPLLRAIADGEPLDPARRRELAITEAALRDRVRSPGLTHPTLTSAISERRQAGVRVVLLGDTEDPGDGVGDRLAATIGTLIGPMTDGSITIRAIPAGRGAAVSVLLSGTERTERILMTADGTIVERR